MKVSKIQQFRKLNDSMTKQLYLLTEDLDKLEILLKEDVSLSNNLDLKLSFTELQHFMIQTLLYSEDIEDETYKM
jgi:hypothetical protein